MSVAFSDTNSDLPNSSANGGKQSGLGTTGPPGTGDEWCTPPRVLLVEDDAICRKLSGKLLSIFGCTFDVAQDGLAAVKAVNSGQYDVVLMDIVMPRMDG
ncbi:CheY-like superfamily [Catenaria anguillulae PL171]|uniref:CheY-like superfamily n=2 Tax=Catenaria anguillulae PL171 TaxID=765915 RepID=A0A1Y2H5R7_9FUNG|nr:CheY-like superfamily [Catenaria anguillulae PL171]